MPSALELLQANIARKLDELRWSQKDLADAMGMKPAQLSRYVSGASSPSLSVLERIAEALSTTPSRLLADPSEMPSPMDSVLEVRAILAELAAGNLDDPRVQSLLAAKPKKK